MNQPTFTIGDTVIFTPKAASLQWAAGERTVTGFQYRMIKLECGNVVLLAWPHELELKFKRG